MKQILRTCTIATLSTVPSSLTAKEATAIRAGPATNFIAMATTAIRIPHDIMLGRNAINRPVECLDGMRILVTGTDDDGEEQLLDHNSSTGCDLKYDHINFNAKLYVSDAFADVPEVCCSCFGLVLVSLLFMKEIQIPVVPEDGATVASLVALSSNRNSNKIVPNQALQANYLREKWLCLCSVHSPQKGEAEDQKCWAMLTGRDR
ncbi:hypothetical protein D5086_030601 [Populus alba]|uniref:Uncharacterized protein n=1 Tax=Populus alba TaxID=43335 RepID=A0ACC4AP90_POPAL